MLVQLKHCITAMTVMTMQTCQALWSPFPQQQLNDLLLQPTHFTFAIIRLLCHHQLLTVSNFSNWRLFSILGNKGSRILPICPYSAIYHTGKIDLRDVRMMMSYSSCYVVEKDSKITQLLCIEWTLSTILTWRVHLIGNRLSPIFHAPWHCCNLHYRYFTYTAGYR
jgi:hypothetical protein